MTYVLSSITIIFSFVLLNSVECSVNSIQIVSSPEGVCKSTAQLNNFLSVSESLKTTCPVVGLIDCGNLNSNKIIENILGSSESTISNGIQLCISEKFASITCSFDKMIAPTFCGAKVADFCHAVSNKICLSIPAKNLPENLESYDQIIRRIVWKSYLSKKKTSLLFLIDSTLSPSLKSSSEDISGIIDKKIQEIIKDVASEDSSYESLDLVEFSATVVNTSKGESAAEIQNLLGKLESERGSAAVAALLHDSWSSVNIPTIKQILTPAQRQSLFAVESAYSAGLSQAEAIVNQWRYRINQGKIVAKFGERASRLLEGVQQSYFDRTAGSLVVRERAERAGLLIQTIRQIISGLYQQQLSILEADITSEYKRTLISIVAKTEGDPTEAYQQALRSVMLKFKNLSGDLEGPGLNLESSRVQTELSTVLLELAKEFPESTAARLEAIRKIDKTTKKPKKKKGKRAIQIGLNLVGMLRPPGYGTLQGFIGYNSLSLFGVPLDLLLGVQNDGDSPEVILRGLISRLYELS